MTLFYHPFRSVWRVTMPLRVSALCLSGAMLIAVGAHSAVAPMPKTLTGYVTVETRDRMTAVQGKADANGPAQFLFCIDLAPGAAAKPAYRGPGRVLYVPQPIPGLPAGVAISGPESIRSALAVAPDTGKGFVFLGKGERSPLPAGDPAAAGATTLNVTVVRRIDWSTGAGPRRGTELSDCFVDAG